MSPQNTEEKNTVKLIKVSDEQKGRVVVPVLLWMAGVPLFLVVILWLIFFRGH